jgi:dTDP-glucose 4,6-dehydratase
MDFKETVILTGFAGFIGSQLLRDLLDDFFVIGIDNMSEGSNPDNYESLKSRDNFVPLIMDITDSVRLPNMLREVIFNKTPQNHVDYVINCAADSHVDRSWDQVNKFIDSNVKGSLNMAEWALDNNVTRFVQVSTDEVFSHSPQPFNEGSRLTPQNIYSSSKASAEMFLMNYQKAYDLPLIITNGANTYGFRQMEEKLIPKTIYKLMRGEKMTLYKTPAQRMWLHVEDHSAGIIAALYNGKVGHRYCLAPDMDQELFTEDLVRMICKEMGKDFDSSVDKVEDRVNYDLRYLMENEIAKKELRWSPSKRIEDELPEIVKWYVEKFK